MEVSTHGAADPVQISDTLPLPVCGYTRSARDRCFKPDADYGHCAAKALTYDGCTLGLRTARSGLISASPLLPARPHDIQVLDDLVAGFSGVAPADKGCIDAVRQALLAERHAVFVITPPRKGMTTPHRLPAAHARLLLSATVRQVLRNAPCPVQIGYLPANVSAAVARHSSSALSFLIDPRGAAGRAGQEPALARPWMPCSAPSGYGL